MGLKQLWKFLVAAVFCLFAGGALAQEQAVCWKHSYGRGVGTVPSACPAGQNDAGLCYQPCAEGFTGVGPVCHQDCPAGWPKGAPTDISCVKPGTYTRPSYPWQIGDPAFNYDNARDRCRAANHHRQHTKDGKDTSQTCEQHGLIWYELPRKGYACDLVTCTATCPAGYRNDGLFCAKVAANGINMYGRGVGQVPQCSSGLQYDAGLCYKGCNAGYGGVGPVCWGQCPADRPVDCGALCGKSAADCANAIIEQVVSVLDVISTIASTVASFGAGSAAKAGAKAAIQNAARQATKGASRSAVKAAIRKQFKEAGQTIAENLLEQYTKAAMGEDFEWESLDPTGIAAAVAAFNKPICQAPGGSMQQTSTSTTTGTTASAPRAFPPLAGRLFKDTARPEVYLVNAQGLKQHIATRQVFEGCGLGYGAIENWNAQQVAAVQSGAQLATPQACVAALAAVRATRSTKK